MATKVPSTKTKQWQPDPNITDTELAEKEVEFIRKHESNNPNIGYNRWPKFNANHT